MIDYSYKRPGASRKPSSTLFGEWLISKLEEYNISSRDLAKYLNVSCGYISKLTRGTIVPTNIMACACAASFRVDSDYVLDLVYTDRGKGVL